MGLPPESDASPMPKLNRNALSARMVRHARPGSYVDGNGLMLRVRDSGSRSWVQRIMVHGRRVDIGLGNAELVSLADARRIAADNRAVARTGGDPRRARTISFADAEPRAMAEKAETWRHGTAAKTARDWRSSMDAYVLPAMGALAVLEDARGTNGHGDLAFPGPRGRKLGATALANALRKAEINGTAHGFRSSFKDWARHEGVDELLSEFALAHVEGSKTVAAYARDDLLEKRRPVMQAWCDHLCGAARN